MADLDIKDIDINMSMNILKNSIMNLIGNSKLPVGITYYILKDILSEIQNIYNDVLQKESQKLNEKIKDNQTDVENENIEEN